jgi:hypothetical protein
MVRLVMIARTRDGLILCGSVDNTARELEPFKKRARKLIQACIGEHKGPAVQVEDPPLYFLYVISISPSSVQITSNSLKTS